VKESITMEGTYNMKFTCGNCGYKYITTLTKGVLAKGHGGACPNCGVMDGTNGIQFAAEQSGTTSPGRKVLLTEPKTYK